MVIKSSASAEIRTLVHSLSGHEETSREAAIARLAVIGARAVPHLVAAYRATSDRGARIAMLRAMEGIGDHRAAAIAREAIREGGDLAVAASGVLRGLLDSTYAATGSEALDTLMTTALDVGAERRVRFAAIDALENMPHDIGERLAKALSNDPDDIVRKRGGPSVSDHSNAQAVWKDALDGHLPDDPAVLRHVLIREGGRAPLNELRKVIDGVRAQEARGPETEPREWRALRGSIHQALALRNSRVALYDLRESLEAATEQLPPSFVSAVQVLGDSSCLDAIAAAYSRSAPAEERWRHLLGTAFRTIAARERITKRHAVMKRISSRWPEASRHLAGV